MKMKITTIVLRSAQENASQTEEISIEIANKKTYQHKKDCKLFMNHINVVYNKHGISKNKFTREYN